GVDRGDAPILRMSGADWAHPMVASKGYSINVNVKDAELPAVIKPVTFPTSRGAELREAKPLGILQSEREAYATPDLAADPTLQASKQALELCRRMPVVPEMR